MGYLKTMVDVMTTEMNAIRCLIDEAGIEYESIVSEIANCEGKVIFMGVGKSEEPKLLLLDNAHAIESPKTKVIVDDVVGARFK